MSLSQFSRFDMNYYPVTSRLNKVRIEKDHINPSTYTPALSKEARSRIKSIAEEFKVSKLSGSSRICAFGAHTIKNGLGPTLARLVQEGWLTHLATNGAGVIHDWEFAFLGSSSEDVSKNVKEGKFGTWEETGLYINLALVVGAFEGLGYGESIGKMITQDYIDIPSTIELEHIICDKGFSLPKRSSAADLLYEIERLNIHSGRLGIEHPYKEYSIQKECFDKGVPFTGHPMFGHDIIYTHKANLGSAIGRTAETDFLRFVSSVSNLEKGVYLSIGSAVMSPMIFEKALSMSRNVKLQKNKDIKDCGIHVFDLQQQTWDWSKGEPPMDNAAYYLRFMKTFSRMGCRVDYTSTDNRDFLVGLYQELNS